MQTAVLSVIFREVEQTLRAVEFPKIKATYLFVINDRYWFLDLSAPHGTIAEVEDRDSVKPTCTLILDVATCEQIFTGELTGQAAFMQGKLRMQGDMAAAIKIEQVINKHLSTQGQMKAAL